MRPGIRRWAIDGGATASVANLLPVAVQMGASLPIQD
jgi:hypothetical protein